MYQRMFYIGLVAAAVLIIGILGVGAFWEYQIKPNQTVATVNGDEITRKEYWKYQTVTLYNQARMYEDYALQVTGQQQTQFLMYAAQFDQMRGDVWGSSDVSEPTVRQMIEDRLYVAGAEEMGIDLSEPVLQQYALNNFAPAGESLVAPLPTPTMIPTRAAWATETQQALETQQSIAMGTPAGSIATPIGTPGATPVGTPSATPAATPAANTEGTRITAQAAFELFQEEVFDDARISLDEYMDMIVKPQVARAKVDSSLIMEVPQVAEQVEVQHILVATEDLANETWERVKSGASFDEVAKSTSTDTISAPTGGKLGWITAQQMPDAFTEAAFSTEPGQFTKPVNTEYGWHIIKVLDKAAERPMSETQYSLAKTEAVENWLEAQREKSNISSDYYEPSPEPTQDQFYPPADAPTPIVRTPVPAPDLSATPVSGPQYSPGASPVASPAATPQGSPAATPAS
jgi:parvulin-like peptidyl-prolyl isomerase